MRFYSAEQVKGALVVDSEALIYGVVEGLRVCKSTWVREHINWVTCPSKLKSSGYKHLYAAPAERWDPLKCTRLPSSALREVEEALRKDRRLERSSSSSEGTW